MNNEFAGLNGFIWWTGVVEDRKDPLKLGRCRVRIVGWHSESVNDAPTETLPWAQALLPLNNPMTFTPRESDMVVGFFLDGENAQHPVMMGVLPGIPQEASGEMKAFSDTRKQKEIDASPNFLNGNPLRYPRNLDEPTTSRLARGDNLYDPAQITYLKSLTTGNKYGVDQNPSYNARYPYNYAIDTESGHAFELDDTPNYERINLMHKTGSHVEFRPTGDVHKKVIGSSNIVVNKDESMHVKGNRIVYIDGDLTYVVNGSVTFQVKKDFTVVARNITLAASANWSGSAKQSASLSGILSSSLGGLTSASTSVSGVISSVTGMISLTATSSGKATYGGKALTNINGATIAMVTAAAPVPGADDTTSAAKPPEGTLAPDGTPFTPPTTVSESVTSSSLNTTEITSGTIPPKIDQIIGNAVNKPDFFKEQVFGTPASTWSGMSEVQISNALTNNPSFLDTLKQDIAAGFQSATSYGKNLGTDLINQTGYKDVLNNYDKLGASISAADQAAGVSGTAKAYSTVARNVAELTASTVSTASKFSSLSVDVIKAKQFLNLQCTKKLVNKYVDDLTDNLKESWNDIKQELKDTESKLKDASDALKDKASEIRKAMDKYDEKAIDEFVNANHKDEACRICAQEASTKLENGVSKSQISKEISDCLYREYLAFKQLYAKSVPLTDKSVADQINGNCP
jgi:hypothetical protein